MNRMVNYIRLAWKLAYMLTKYEFNNKLLGGVTLLRTTLDVTWT